MCELVLEKAKKRAEFKKTTKRDEIRKRRKRTTKKTQENWN